MLNQISSAKSTANSVDEDVRELLVGCHQRIRHFTEVATKLAHAQAAAQDEIRSAAEAVYRYYSVSLPLHEADEEDTLRPRLDGVADERVHHALAAMHDQHLAIDDLLERLLPLLKMVSNNPETLTNAGAEMCSTAKALDEIFRAHLQLEEEVIFPAIDVLLNEQQRGDMLREMRGRRKQ
jgi:iron-sulfur cluster repair protein YtfE (RIC family)